ncbi:hypothetical protein AX14_002354 [Amanita brunnescens Koide BX004]|nr:hypothetical protein AX14_002354 [Amanita brunnescens Koide BX004]
MIHHFSVLHQANDNLLPPGPITMLFSPTVPQPMSFPRSPSPPAGPTNLSTPLPATVATPDDMLRVYAY